MVASCWMTCWLPLLAQAQDLPATPSLATKTTPSIFQRSHETPPAPRANGVVLLLYSGQPHGPRAVSSPKPQQAVPQHATLSVTTPLPPLPMSGGSQHMNPSLKADDVVVTGEPARRFKFEINVEDETLYLALRRWAADAGYQLVWHAGKDFPAYRTRYEVLDFESAVERVMMDTESSSYPLHACAYPNKVMRVLHIAQSCERK